MTDTVRFLNPAGVYLKGDTHETTFAAGATTLPDGTPVTTDHFDLGVLNSLRGSRTISVGNDGVQAAPETDVVDFTGTSIEEALTGLPDGAEITANANGIATPAFGGVSHSESIDSALGITPPAETAPAAPAADNPDSIDNLLGQTERPKGAIHRADVEEGQKISPADLGYPEVIPGSGIYDTSSPTGNVVEETPVDLTLDVSSAEADAQLAAVAEGVQEIIAERAAEGVTEVAGGTPLRDPSEYAEAPAAAHDAVDAVEDEQALVDEVLENDPSLADDEGPPEAVEFATDVELGAALVSDVAGTVSDEDAAAALAETPATPRRGRPGRQ